MLRRVGSTAFWLLMVLSSVALFPVALVLWLLTVGFDRRLWLLHRFTCFWGSLYTWLIPIWSVEIRGREKIRPRETYVMVANHQSLLDILVLFRLFAHFKWVSKVENFRVPVIGWNMRLNRYIQLKRGDRDSIVGMLRACRSALLEGSSIMMFPEGTRSSDGRLRPFKLGAFELALDARVPILPIVVDGTSSALPKHGFVLRGRHRFRVTVLDAIPFESIEGEAPETLALQVRSLIADQLKAPAGAARSGGSAAA